MMMKSVMFGGSRSLGGAAASAFVGRVVGAALVAGWSVSVGCASGADQLALESVLAAGAAGRLSVSCAGAEDGAGFWTCSASLSLLRAAAAAGARVAWLAGGALAIPLRARLLLRSRAALAGCSAAVFFAPGPGSLAVAACAVAAGLPVWAICLVAPGAPRGCAGSWVSSSWLGFAAWQWVPAASAPQLPLF
jgi:hypothetical protein